MGENNDNKDDRKARLDGVTVQELIEKNLYKLEELAKLNLLTNQKSAALLTNVAPSAPVRIPARESLTIDLVPSDIIFRLEEQLADEMKWSSVMWTFLGAVLGIIINWATSDPIKISRPSQVVMALLLTITLITWLAARDYKKRADVTRTQIANYSKRPRAKA